MGVVLDHLKEVVFASFSLGVPYLELVVFGSGYQKFLIFRNRDSIDRLFMRF